MSSRVAIALLRTEFADGEVLVTHDQTDFALPCLASHPPAEATQLAEALRILDVLRRGVATGRN